MPPIPSRPSSPIAASGVILVAIALGALAARHRREHPPIRTVAIVAPAPVQRGEAAHGRVDLNQAGPELLERLPRIGPSLARRIVDDRAERGPFRTVDDLDRVRGIGPAILDAVRELVTVTPASGDAGPSLAPPADDG